MTDYRYQHILSTAEVWLRTQEYVFKVHNHVQPLLKLGGTIMRVPTVFCV